ncbi:hypothetical protein PM082_019731 [Marasmius tenuissimus]|nr:hypothetical protein PM082_019731 [Marasmius tenuissimus]
MATDCAFYLTSYTYEIVSRPIGTLALSYLVYGISIFSLVSLVHIKVSEGNERRIPTFYHRSAILLALTTIAIISQTLYMIHHAVKRLSRMADNPSGDHCYEDDRVGYGDNVVQAFVAVFSNIGIESILVSTSIGSSHRMAHSFTQIARFFMIWEYKKRSVKLSCILMSFIVNVIGISSTMAQVINRQDAFEPKARVLKSGVFDGASIISNVILSGLIAGRIWWIRYQVNLNTIGGRPCQTHGMIAPILLESAAAYPLVKIFTVFYTRVINVKYGVRSPILVTTIPVQVAVISVILLVNRITSGRSTASLEQVNMDTSASGEDPEIAGMNEVDIIPLDVHVPLLTPPKELGSMSYDDPKTRKTTSDGSEAVPLEDNQPPPPSYSTTT